MKSRLYVNEYCNPKIIEYFDYDLIKCGNNKLYRFTLEEEEYEYLLQEKEPQTKSTWWKIIIEILACLIAIASLWLLWPFFEGFCQGMFESIY